jgi:hypothetical protein
VQRRRNSHIEGLATHDDPELCGYARKDVAEALAGAHAGRVPSPEKESDSQVPRCFPECRRRHLTRRQGKAWRDLAWPKTPSMRGNTMRENRETLHLLTADGAVGRDGKSEDRIHRRTEQGV